MLCKWNWHMHSPERIWIIGASEGIGAALAQVWAARGAELILSARSKEKLTSLCSGLGPKHIALPLDVANRASLEEAAAQIAQIGLLDRVIMLAALYDPGRVSELERKLPQTSCR